VRLGLDVPLRYTHPEIRLYELLAETEGNAAHSSYNALIRRLVSFESAAVRPGTQGRGLSKTRQITPLR
jgi:hypothetical protein